MAIAFLSAQKRLAVVTLLLDITRSDFDELFERVLDLPAEHLSVQLRLPRLLTPELEALRQAVDNGDEEVIDNRLGPALSVLDTPERWAEVGRAVIELAHTDTVDRGVAAVAMVDLDTEPSGLLRSSLIEALFVSVGAATTPSGLIACSR